MRKLIYHIAASLDGSIADRDGSFDAFAPIRGDHVTEYLDSLNNYDTVLMGRGTYDVGLRANVTNPYPAMKSYVFTRSLHESPDENIELVQEGAADLVRRLKQQPGKPIYLCGGGELASTLLGAGLIDELIVKLNPLLLGDGIRIFTRVAQPVYLDLVSSKVYHNGVLLLTYSVRASSR